MSGLLYCCRVFATGDRVLDVAGGGGSYSILGAALHADCHFRIVEYGAMVRVSQQWIAHYESTHNNSGGLMLQGKVDVRHADMFSAESWKHLKTDFSPNKIFFSNIFHDWSLETNLQLASYAFDALPIGGEIIVHEMPLEEDGEEEEESIAVGFSEVLRVWTEGTQYKRSEITAVLQDAGFKTVNIQAGHGPYCIFRGTK